MYELLRYNTILKPSSDKLLREAYELLRYNTILKPSSDKLLREAYELLRYDTILKPSSDEFTTIFLRVSAITVQLSTRCLQISPNWENIIGLVDLKLPTNNCESACE